MLLGGSMVLACSPKNITIKKHYKVDEYIPEINAYYAGERDPLYKDVKFKKFKTPTDNKYSTQKSYSMQMIGNIESVWNSYTGKGTKIAVIDDGFSPNHPEYVRADGTSALSEDSRYYYVNSNDEVVYSDDIDEDYNSEEGEWDTHGTNTSTTAAAPIDNGGGVGIAPDAEILALKSDFTFDSINYCIDYAISCGVDVINMSLGAYSTSFTDGFGDSQSGSYYVATALEDACKRAYNAGIIVVAAAGNEATYNKSYPACNYKVIGVGALEKNDVDTLAAFTNYVSTSQTGEVNVDILAPGYVYTAGVQGNSKSNRTEGYSGTQGTSFSSPIVAGAACLWKEKYPDGTVDEFQNQLFSTAADIGAYATRQVKPSLWGYKTGPFTSNITAGRLDVGALLDISNPYVNLSQTSLDLVIDQTKQITIKSSSGEISYTSLNPSIATVSSTGLVTAKAAGSTSIRVTATKNAVSEYVDLPVTVSPIVQATSISSSISSLQIEQGQEVDLAQYISATPSNASRIFMFESTDETVASVDMESGLLTGLKPGQTTINVYPVYGEGEASITVTVAAPTAATIEYIDYLNLQSNSYPDSDTSFSKDGYEFKAYKAANFSSKMQFRAAEGYIYNVDPLPGLTSITLETSSGGTFSGTLYTGTSSNPSTNSQSVSNGNTYSVGSGHQYFKIYNSSSKAGYLERITFNYSGSTPTPTVDSVSITPSSLALDLYNNTSSSLTATVNGTNNPSQEVSWESSNTSIATVSSTGLVTAKGTGSCQITATSTLDSTKSGSCTVTVTDSTPSSRTLTSITISGHKTALFLGDDFDFGGTVTAHYSDSTTGNVTSNATFSGYDMYSEGTQTVTVSYTESAVTKTTTYQLTISLAPVVVEGSVTYSLTSKTAAQISSGSAPSGTSIGFNNNGSNNNDQMTSGKREIWTIKGYEDYKITRIKANLHKNSGGSGAGNVALTNNGNSISLSKTSYSASDLGTSYSLYTIIDSEFEVNGDVVLTLTSTANSFWCDSIVVDWVYEDTSDKIVESINATYNGNDIYVGKNLNESQIEVTVNYTDSTKYPSHTLASTEYQISGFNSSSAGISTVAITYVGKYETKDSATISTSVNINIIPDTIESVTASVSKTFHPGETISSSDIVVTAHKASGDSEIVTDFTFAENGYQFTYEDAPSGGSNGSKIFQVSYQEKVANVTVNVSRVAYTEPTSISTSYTSTEFNASTISKSSSTPSDTLVVIDGTSYIVTTNTYIYNGKLSFGKSAGSIQNMNAFDKDIVSISISQSGRSDGVISISKDGSNWVTYSQNEAAKGGYRYFKIEYTGTSSSYSNITNITFNLYGDDTALKLANYVMFEDTIGQCETKLDILTNKLNELSSSEIETFLTSDSYVISTARERYYAWAANQHKDIVATASGITLNERNSTTLSNQDNQNILLSIGIISIAAVAIISTLVFIKKKRV